MRTSRTEAAEYLHELTLELARFAARTGMPSIANVLRVASLEAKSIAIDGAADGPEARLSPASDLPRRQALNVNSRVSARNL